MTNPCPDCPDGHDDPRRRTWAVWMPPVTSGDGRHRVIAVGRTDGSHVSDSEVAWLKSLIEDYRSDSKPPPHHGF